MSWYGERMAASAFGHYMPAHTGEGGTYMQRREAEDKAKSDEYRVIYLNKWLLEQWGMTP